MPVRDDMTSADLEAGGLLSPTQGAPTKKPKKKADPIVVAVPARRAANPPAGDVSTPADQLPAQRESPRPSMREFRADEAARRVRGPVYPSFDPVKGGAYTVDEINALCDSWGTYVVEKDLRRLAERFMRWSQNVDRQHDRETLAGQLIASDIVRRDETLGEDFPTPTWIAGVYVLDGVLGDIRAGKLRGFSIDVYAGRERITVRVTGKGEVPDLTGVTDFPFVPNYVKVDGERVITIDRLVEPDPWGFSLVDRPAIRQDFTVQRTAPAVGAPVLRRAEGEQLPADLAVDLPPAAGDGAVPPVVIDAAAAAAAEPAPEPPVNDDEKPATRGFLRALLAPLADLFRSGAARQLSAGAEPSTPALLPDGTPPPELLAVLPPVDESTAPTPDQVAPAPESSAVEAQPQPPQEAPVTTPAPTDNPAVRTIAVTTLDDAVARMIAVRFAPPPVATVRAAGAEQRVDGESAWGFGSLWEQQEVYQNLYAMWSLLGDIVWSRVCYGPEIESNDAVETLLQALAKDFTEFLGELRELLEFEVAEEEGIAVETRAEVRRTRRAEITRAACEDFITRSVASVQGAALDKLFPAETGAEVRAGKKHSAATVERMKKALEGCRSATEHLEKMIAEGTDDEGAEDDAAKVDPDADKKNAKKSAPAVAVPPAPTEAQRTLAQLEKTVREQEAQIAALEQPAVAPIPAAPAVPAQPSAEDVRVAELRAAIESNKRRIEQFSTTRRPSSQPSGDEGGQSTSADASASRLLGPAEIEARQKRYRDQVAGIASSNQSGG